MVPFVDPSSLEAHEPRPGWTGRFFHSAEMTFAHYAIAAGAGVHAHDHPNEEVWHVVEGALEVTVGAETRVLRAGEAAIVPAGERHRGRRGDPSTRGRSSAQGVGGGHPSLRRSRLLKIDATSITVPACSTPRD